MSATESGLVSGPVRDPWLWRSSRSGNAAALGYSGTCCSLASATLAELGRSKSISSGAANPNFRYKLMRVSGVKQPPESHPRSFLDHDLHQPLTESSALVGGHNIQGHSANSRSALYSGRTFPDGQPDGIPADVTVGPMRRRNAHMPPPLPERTSTGTFPMSDRAVGRSVGRPRVAAQDGHEQFVAPLTLPAESMPQASLKSEAALLVDPLGARIEVVDTQGSPGANHRCPARSRQPAG